MTVQAITVLPLEGHVQVQFATEEGAIHYEVYGPEGKETFIGEVEGAEAYVAIMGW